MSKIVVCAGKQRCDNREQSQAIFQFQERPKKIFLKKKREGGHKRHKEI